jgi:hypothetical protein
VARLIAVELRRLARWWPAWVLLPAVALLGRALLGRNADAYVRWVNFDPQPDYELIDQRHTDAAALATSGLGCVQLIAFLLGAALVARARTPAVKAARAVVAVVAGLVLAVADLAAVLPGQSGVPWAAAGVGALVVALSGPLGAGVAGFARRPWVAVAVGAVLFIPVWCVLWYIVIAVTW